MYKFFRPWLMITDQEIQPSHSRSTKMVFGEFIEELLNAERYFHTQMPRIPIPEKKRYQAIMAMNLDVWRRRTQQHSLDEFVAGRNLFNLRAQVICRSTLLSAFLITLPVDASASPPSQTKSILS